MFKKQISIFTAILFLISTIGLSSPGFTYAELSTNFTPQNPIEHNLSSLQAGSNDTVSFQKAVARFLNPRDSFSFRELVRNIKPISTSHTVTIPEINYKRYLPSTERIVRLGEITTIISSFFILSPLAAFVFSTAYFLFGKNRKATLSFITNLFKFNQNISSTNYLTPLYFIIYVISPFLLLNLSQKAFDEIHRMVNASNVDSNTPDILTNNTLFSQTPFNLNTGITVDSLRFSERIDRTNELAYKKIRMSLFQILYEAQLHPQGQIIIDALINNSILTNETNPVRQQKLYMLDVLNQMPLAELNELVSHLNQYILERYDGNNAPQIEADSKEEVISTLQDYLNEYERKMEWIQRVETSLKSFIDDIEVNGTSFRLIESLYEETLRLNINGHNSAPDGNKNFEEENQVRYNSYLDEENGYGLIEGHRLFLKEWFKELRNDPDGHGLVIIAQALDNIYFEFHRSNSDKLLSTIVWSGLNTKEFSSGVNRLYERLIQYRNEVGGKSIMFNFGTKQPQQQITLFNIAAFETLSDEQYAWLQEFILSIHQKRTHADGNDYYHYVSDFEKTKEKNEFVFIPTIEDLQNARNGYEPAQYAIIKTIFDIDPETGNVIEILDFKPGTTLYAISPEDRMMAEMSVLQQGQFGMEVQYDTSAYMMWGQSTYGVDGQLLANYLDGNVAIQPQAFFADRTGSWSLIAKIMTILAQGEQSGVLTRGDKILLERIRNAKVVIGGKTFYPFKTGGFNWSLLQDSYAAENDGANIWTDIGEAVSSHIDSSETGEFPTFSLIFFKDGDLKKAKRRWTYSGRLRMHDGTYRSFEAGDIRFDKYGNDVIVNYNDLAHGMIILSEMNEIILEIINNPLTKALNNNQVLNYWHLFAGQKFALKLYDIPYINLLPPAPMKAFFPITKAEFQIPVTFPETRTPLTLGSWMNAYYGNFEGPRVNNVNIIRVTPGNEENITVKSLVNQEVDQEKIYELGIPFTIGNERYIAYVEFSMGRKNRISSHFTTDYMLDILTNFFNALDEDPFDPNTTPDAVIDWQRTYSVNTLNDLMNLIAEDIVLPDTGPEGSSALFQPLAQGADEGTLRAWQTLEGFIYSLTATSYEVSFGIIDQLAGRNNGKSFQWQGELTFDVERLAYDLRDEISRYAIYLYTFGVEDSFGVTGYNGGFNVSSIERAITAKFKTLINENTYEVNWKQFLTSDRTIRELDPTLGPTEIPEFVSLDDLLERLSDLDGLTEEELPGRFAMIKIAADLRLLENLMLIIRAQSDVDFKFDNPSINVGLEAEIANIRAGVRLQLGRNRIGGLSVTTNTFTGYLSNADVLTFDLDNLSDSQVEALKQWAYMPIQFANVGDDLKWLFQFTASLGNNQFDIDGLRRFPNTFLMFMMENTFIERAGFSISYSSQSSQNSFDLRLKAPLTSASRGNVIIDAIGGLSVTKFAYQDKRYVMPFAGLSFALSGNDDDAGFDASTTFSISPGTGAFSNIAETTSRRYQGWIDNTRMPSDIADMTQLGFEDQFQKTQAQLNNSGKYIEEQLDQPSELDDSAFFVDQDPIHSYLLTNMPVNFMREKETQIGESLVDFIVQKEGESNEDYEVRVVRQLIAWKLELRVRELIADPEGGIDTQALLNTMVENNKTAAYFDVKINKVSYRIVFAFFNDRVITRVLVNRDERVDGILRIAGVKSLKKIEVNNAAANQLVRELDKQYNQESDAILQILENLFVQDTLENKDYYLKLIADESLSSDDRDEMFFDINQQLDLLHSLAKVSPLILPIPAHLANVMTQVATFQDENGNPRNINFKVMTRTIGYGFDAEVYKFIFVEEADGSWTFAVRSFTARDFFLTDEQLILPMLELKAHLTNVAQNTIEQGTEEGKRWNLNLQLYEAVEEMNDWKPTDAAHISLKEKTLELLQAMSDYALANDKVNMQIAEALYNFIVTEVQKNPSNLNWLLKSKTIEFLEYQKTPILVQEAIRQALDKKLSDPEFIATGVILAGSQFEITVLGVKVVVKFGELVEGSDKIDMFTIVGMELDQDTIQEILDEINLILQGNNSTGFIETDPLQEPLNFSNPPGSSAFGTEGLALQSA